LRELGQYRPVVVNRPGMEVLAGNHVLQAARALGWERLEVCLVEVDAETARRIVLADNRTSDLATYDSEQLVELLSEVGDLTGTGYDQAALEQLLEETAGDMPVDDDEVPEAPAEPTTQRGERIELGEHVVVCGDARDHDVYAALLDDARADALWTDPPYGVSYEGRTPSRLRIARKAGSRAARTAPGRLPDRASRPRAPRRLGGISLRITAEVVVVYGDADRATVTRPDRATR